MMRLGIPDWLIKLDGTVNSKGRVRVRYAYGLTKAFKRGGAGGCGNGAVQGGEDSPPKWIMYEDPFNTWWEEQGDFGLVVRVSETAEIRMRGGGFADDKKPVEGSVGKLNRWLARSADYGFFHGVDVRLGKCQGHASIVGDKGLATTVKDLPDLVIPTGPDSVLVPIQLLEATQSIKTLGERGNALLLWAEAVDEIREMSDSMGRMLKARVPREITLRLWNTCIEAKVSYKLFMATVSEQELNEAMGKAYRAFKQSLGLPVSAPNALTYAFGLGDSWTDLNIRRLVAILAWHLEAEQVAWNGTVALTDWLDGDGGRYACEVLWTWGGMGNEVMHYMCMAREVDWSEAAHRWEVKERKLRGLARYILNRIWLLFFMFFKSGKPTLNLIWKKLKLDLEKTQRPMEHGEFGYKF